jgi:hypothetical protein
MKGLKLNWTFLFLVNADVKLFGKNINTIKNNEEPLLLPPGRPVFK